ncbi:hypothetical protein E5D57_007632 [Metarhizium anisopliae]|nr:hypothetical protein E5D57_007632 [Metarhizium anisopliae]
MTVLDTLGLIRVPLLVQQPTQDLGGDPILLYHFSFNCVIAEPVVLVGNELTAVREYALWLCAHSWSTEDVKSKFAKNGPSMTSVNKQLRTLYGRVFQLPRDGDVGVTLSNKQIVNVGDINRSLWNAA